MYTLSSTSSLIEYLSLIISFVFFKFHFHTSSSFWQGSLGLHSHMFWLRQLEWAFLSLLQWRTIPQTAPSGRSAESFASCHSPLHRLLTSALLVSHSLHTSQLTPRNVPHYPSHQRIFISAPFRIKGGFFFLYHSLLLIIPKRKLCIHKSGSALNVMWKVYGKLLCG